MGVKTIEEGIKLKEIQQFSYKTEIRDDGGTVKIPVFNKILVDFLEPDDLIFWQEPNGKLYKTVMTEEGLCKTELP